MKFLLKAVFMAFLSVPFASSAGKYNEPQEEVGRLLEQIAKLDGTTIKGEGILKKAFLQFDEDNISYVLQIGNRKYSVNLDDGRGTSQKAKNCDKAEFIGMNPNKGCPITFEGEYHIDLGDSATDTSLTIWSVEFK